MDTAKKTNILLIVVAILVLLNIAVTAFVNYKPYRVISTGEKDWAVIKYNVYNGKMQYIYGTKVLDYPVPKESGEDKVAH